MADDLRPAGLDPDPDPDPIGLSAIVAIVELEVLASAEVLEVSAVGSDQLDKLQLYVLAVRNCNIS